MLKIGGREVAAGQRARIEIPVGRVPSQAMVSLPVRAINGSREGVSLWLSAAIHGDEINGVEIIRRVLDVLDPKRLSGTVIAAPIVNVFGFSSHSRYLPDRRDLNRSFPGSRKGSLAARLAKILMSEIVEPCSHGIDLHTGSAGRINLPQLRCDLDDEETRRWAEAFGAPVILHTKGPGGSLRRVASKSGKRVIVYEAGEVLRYNSVAIEVGVRGVLSAMAWLGMIDEDTVARHPEPPAPPVSCTEHTWVRAQRGGIVHIDVELGARVTKKQALAVISDPMGDREDVLRSPAEGYVIGGITNPLVHRGDAVLHLAKVPAGETDSLEMPEHLASSDKATPDGLEFPVSDPDGSTRGNGA